MTVSTCIKTIYNQLMTTGKMIVWSWGAHQWLAIDEKTLQFKVQGHHFTRYVRIIYVDSSDTYSIQFGQLKNSLWNMTETVEFLYFDQLVDVIDKKVEYISAYQ